MNKLSLICSTVFLLLSPLAVAAQDSFPSIDAFVKSTVKAEGQLSDSATGDLNGDGLKDWAGVIHRRPEDASPTYQLFVLLRQPQGGFQLAAKSIEEEIPGMGCCWMESLEIRRSGIYIQNNAKTASTMEAATHQFQLHNGEWRLIGLKIYFTDHTPKAQATVDTDMNLLTGLVIETKQKGNKKPTTKSRRKKFSTYLLKDYDFSNGFGIEDAGDSQN